MKRVRAIVTGQVQGVFYRASTEEEAIKLGVTGYVQNLDTGQVEMVVEGQNDSVDKLLKWASTGPTLAKVNSVEITPLEGPPAYSSFSIAY